MRAFVIQKLAHPSQIALSYDVPEPTAGRNQVLVDVYSAGLNFFDVSNFMMHHCSVLIIRPRFYNPKANISTNLLYPSSLAPSLQAGLHRTPLSQ